VVAGVPLPPCTVAVAVEVPLADPPELLAVTVTAIVSPASQGGTAYELLVAPLMLQQFAPVGSQFCHWEPYDTTGSPDHEPRLAVSVCPACAVPEITGGAVLAGVMATMTGELRDVDVIEPALFVAVTETSRVVPMSSGPS
jgi:hypothetical protein